MSWHLKPAPQKRHRSNLIHEASDRRFFVEDNYLERPSRRTNSNFASLDQHEAVQRAKHYSSHHGSDWTSHKPPRSSHEKGVYLSPPRYYKQSSHSSGYRTVPDKTEKSKHGSSAPLSNAREFDQHLSTHFRYDKSLKRPAERLISFKFNSSPRANGYRTQSSHQQKRGKSKLSVEGHRDRQSSRPEVSKRDNDDVLFSQASKKVEPSFSRTFTFSENCTESGVRSLQQQSQRYNLSKSSRPRDNNKLSGPSSPSLRSSEDISVDDSSSSQPKKELNSDYAVNSTTSHTVERTLSSEPHSHNNELTNLIDSPIDDLCSPIPTRGPSIVASGSDRIETVNDDIIEYHRQFSSEELSSHILTDVHEIDQSISKQSHSALNDIYESPSQQSNTVNDIAFERKSDQGSYDSSDVDPLNLTPLSPFIKVYSSESAARVGSVFHNYSEQCPTSDTSEKTSTLLQDSNQQIPSLKDGDVSKVNYAADTSKTVTSLGDENSFSDNNSAAFSFSKTLSERFVPPHFSDKDSETLSECMPTMTTPILSHSDYSNSDSTPDTQTVARSKVKGNDNRSESDIASVSSKESDIASFDGSVSDADQEEESITRLSHNPLLNGCRTVDLYKKLNRISEGTYGAVYRAQYKPTGEIVALKHIKYLQVLWEEGFPLTALREISILLELKNEHIVQVYEIVVDSANPNQVFIVMEYVEHEFKRVLAYDRPQFSLAERKSLIYQLLEAIAYMHKNWVMHRDLKTPNLLYSNRGTLKICDFGMARKFGDPIQPYTQNIVTLWYRAPELLLGTTEYTEAIDMWSAGCIMAEILLMKPLFSSSNEIKALDQIFRLCGTPSEKTWPGFSKLTSVKKYNLEFANYTASWRKIFPVPKAHLTESAALSEAGIDLLRSLLNCDPKQRCTAADALNHPFFTERPEPQRRHLMPTAPDSNARVHDTHHSNSLKTEAILAEKMTERFGRRINAQQYLSELDMTTQQKKLVPSQPPSFKLK